MMKKRIKFEEFQKEWSAEITEGNPNTLELGKRFLKNGQGERDDVRQ
jgi:hypothetical protein